MLPKPTIALIQKECKSIESDPFTKLTDDALGQLLAKFPLNTQAAQVLLKVVTLDQRYSTRIRYKDMDRLAFHIAHSGVDKHIGKRSLEAVELIWKCEGILDYYSFATKFCSWHNPTAFPIYDRNVDECLWAYKMQDGFASFRRKDLGEYKELVRVVNDFRDHYGLTRFNYRQLDRFMWSVGSSILKLKHSIIL